MFVRSTGVLFSGDTIGCFFFLVVIYAFPGLRVRHRRHFDHETKSKIDELARTGGNIEEIGQEAAGIARVGRRIETNSD